MEKNMENKEKIWTEAEVIKAFEEAIRTLKKLPSEKLHDYFTIWPEVIYTPIEIIRMSQKPKKWSATPEAISRMEKVCKWIHFLESVEERKIIWLRATRISWRFICYEFGISRATGHRKWKKAILTITQKLNQIPMFTNS
jgi:hypothetical protein